MIQASLKRRWHMPFLFCYVRLGEGTSAVQFAQEGSLRCSWWLMHFFFFCLRANSNAALDDTRNNIQMGNSPASSQATENHATFERGSYAASREMPSLQFGFRFEANQTRIFSMHEHDLSVHRCDVHGLAFAANDRCKSSGMVNKPVKIAVLRPCASEGRACGFWLPVQFGQQRTLLRPRAERIAMLAGITENMAILVIRHTDSKTHADTSLPFTSELSIACHSGTKVSDWARGQDTFWHQREHLGEGDQSSSQGGGWGAKGGPLVPHFFHMYQ